MLMFMMIIIKVSLFSLLSLLYLAHCDKVKPNHLDVIHHNMFLFDVANPRDAFQKLD